VLNINQLARESRGRRWLALSACWPTGRPPARPPARQVEAAPGGLIDGAVALVSGSPEWPTMGEIGGQIKLAIGGGGCKHKTGRLLSSRGA